MNVLVINGHDYSAYVERRGLGWKRNDLDSEKTMRTKNGKMRRDKIGTKRTCEYTMLPMTQTLTAQLDDDLSKATFTATYSDLHGKMTREFYCSSFNATLSEVTEDGTELWEDSTFNMIEV